MKKMTLVPKIKNEITHYWMVVERLSSSYDQMVYLVSSSIRRHHACLVSKCRFSPIAIYQIIFSRFKCNCVITIVRHSLNSISWTQQRFDGIIIIVNRPPAWQKRSAQRVFFNIYTFRRFVFIISTDGPLVYLAQSLYKRRKVLQHVNNCYSKPFVRTRKVPADWLAMAPGIRVVFDVTAPFSCTKALCTGVGTSRRSE